MPNSLLMLTKIADGLLMLTKVADGTTDEF